MPDLRAFDEAPLGRELAEIGEARSPGRPATRNATAVLLDAFLVRLLHLPVFLRLVGASAWYLPAWLDRILPDVHSGHGSAGGEAAAGEPASPTAPTQPVAAGARDRS